MQRSDKDREPTPAELRAVEREWPLIVAELGVLDAEILIADADGEPSVLDGHRLARAEQGVRDAARLVRRTGRRSRRSA